jgi:aminoglycoside phosphotransferase
MTTVSPASLLEAINQEHRLALTLAARYSGGEQGAYALVGADGARLVLKWTAGLGGVERFRRAASVAKRLRARGYPTPEYLYYGSVYDTSYLIQSELPGHPMGRLTAAFLPSLLALNELQAGQAGAGAGPHEWPKIVVDSVLYGADGYCLLDTMRSYSAVTDRLLDTLQAVVAAHAADTDTTTDDIVHFDFTAANILVGDRQITGVIDWEGACAGDRAFDLATLLFYSADRPEICRLLWRRARELSGVAALRVYLAHLILRQVEWSIRHHNQPTIERWLARAEQVLHEFVRV